MNLGGTLFSDKPIWLNIQVELQRNSGFPVGELMWLNMIYQIHALHCFAKISVFDMSNKEMLSPSPAGILTQDICGSNKHVGFQKQWPFQVPKLEVPTLYKAKKKA